MLRHATPIIVRSTKRAQSVPDAPMEYALLEVHKAGASKPMDVFDGIREGCRFVAETAGHVRIEAKRIADYAGSLSREASAPAKLDTTSHYVGSEDATTAYFVTLDAINFGSGYFPHLRKRPGMSGYLTIATSLTDRFRASGPILAEELVRITAQDCLSLFGQDPENAPIRELMSLFAQAWNDLGRHLIEGYDGSCPQLIQAASHSAGRLVDVLSAQPLFRDEATYRGATVPFYKRAQLLASDLALALNGAGPGRFDDLDRLTIFADNLIPHVLRTDGLLTYDAHLCSRIERGEGLSSGSAEEVEIRACAVHAAESLVDELRRMRRSVTARDLDILLWNRGQRPEYKRLPRHRTRSVFY